MDDCCGAPKQPPTRPFLIAARWLIICLLCGLSLPLHAAEIKKHLEIAAGDASLNLNAFSAQTDIQVLFDYNIVRTLTTKAIDGTYGASDALRRMLKGTGLQFDWVNDRTIAVTPKKTLGQKIADWLSRRKKRLHSNPGDSDEVVVSAHLENDEPPPAGARALHFDRRAIERSGLATTQDFLRTRPELFGGGPNLGTVLGAEQQSNTAFGVGANFRGLGAGSTVALINGRPIAPSGNTAAFADISNIPLSAIDHIDMVPEGGTALSGGEAVGGVINFVLRDRFVGAETQARTGFASGNTLDEQQLNQLWGTRLGEASSMIALEYYHRDGLAAADRTQATSNLVPFGGSNFGSPFGNPGTLLVGSQTWAIPRGQDGRSLSSADLTAGTQSLHDLNEGATILPSQTRVNLYTRSTLPLTDDTHVFADALLGDRRFVSYRTGASAALTVPQSNPFYVNPSGDPTQPVQVLYGFLSDLGPTRSSGRVKTGNLALGLSSVNLAGWNTTEEFGYVFESQNTQIEGLVNFAALDVALADKNPLTAFNPFGDGSHNSPATLAGIRSQDQFNFDSKFWFARATADRIVLALPGGDSKIVLGSEVKHQTLSTTSIIAQVPSVANENRSVWAGFSEIRIPVVGPSNRLVGIEGLELSAAERIERYSDQGSISTPSFTAAWSPFKSLKIRATDAWIFKPPNLGDLSETRAGSVFGSLPDPSSASGQSIALIAFGGNRELRAERGRSWSVGLDYSPLAVPGLTLALTHYDIFIDGRIGSIDLSSNVLSDPRFAAFVIRDPTPQQRATACNRGAFVGGDLNSCLTAPITAIVDGRLLNLSRIRTRGFDVAAKYTQSTPVGDFEFGLDGTYVSEFAEALTSTSPLVDIVNTQHNPLSVRARASFGYKFRRIDAAAFLNYAGRYRDTASVPERSVGAWTTLDAQVSYDLNTLSESLWSGLRLSASVQNLFGVHPPFLNNQVGVGYDQENAQPLGRVVSVSIRKRW